MREIKERGRKGEREKDGKRFIRSSVLLWLTAQELIRVKILSAQVTEETNETKLY